MKHWKLSSKKILPKKEFAQKKTRTLLKPPCNPNNQQRKLKRTPKDLTRKETTEKSLTKPTQRTVNPEPEEAKNSEKEDKERPTGEPIKMILKNKINNKPNKKRKSLSNPKKNKTTPSLYLNSWNKDRLDNKINKHKK